jgi:hypothetical protein
MYVRSSSYFGKLAVRYYEEPEFFTKNDINKIKKMMADGYTPEDIQYELNKLKNKKKNFIYPENSDSCVCDVAIDLLLDQTQQIIELHALLPKTNFTLEAFDTSIRAVLSWRHVRYIQKYGVPDDGIFLEELLNEFE